MSVNPSSEDVLVFDFRPNTVFFCVQLCFMGFTEKGTKTVLKEIMVERVLFECVNGSSRHYGYAKVFVG